MANSSCEAWPELPMSSSSRSSSDSSSAASNVSRLIEEENLVDAVFELCDEEQNGYVPVSKFIECIHLMAPENGNAQPEVRQRRLSILLQVLDPQNTNKLINNRTFREGINSWKKIIEDEEDEGAGEEDEDLPVCDGKNEVFFSPSSPSIIACSSRSKHMPSLRKSHRCMPTDSIGSISLPTSSLGSHSSPSTSYLDRIDAYEAQVARMKREIEERNSVVNQAMSELEAANQEKKRTLSLLQQRSDKVAELEKECSHKTMQLEGLLGEVDSLTHTKSKTLNVIKKKEEYLAEREKTVTELYTRLEEVQVSMQLESSEKTEALTCLQMTTERVAELEKLVDEKETQLEEESSRRRHLEVCMTDAEAVNKELINEAEELRSELSERKPTATRLIFDKSIESDGDMISQDLVDLSYSTRAVLNNPAHHNGSPNGSLAVEIMSSLGKMCPDARSPSPINDKEYSHLSIDLPELLGSYCNQELQEKMKREVLHLSEKIADMVLQVEMAREREDKTADDCSKLEELVRSLEGRISNCSCSGDADFMQRGFESLSSKSTRNHISNELRIKDELTGVPAREQVPCSVFMTDVARKSSCLKLTKSWPYLNTLHHSYEVLAVTPPSVTVDGSSRKPQYCHSATQCEGELGSIDASVWVILRWGVFLTTLLMLVGQLHSPPHYIDFPPNVLNSLFTLKHLGPPPV